MAALAARRMEYHDRFALQQADQAIRKDVVRALVELISNSNDSYYRMETEDQKVSGAIVVEIQRKRRNSVIRVRDFAEGMSSRTMNEKVGTYGAPTSGFLEGKSVRGLWGRGLKDSFYGLGHGWVTSIRNKNLYEARLFIKDGAPMYEYKSLGTGSFRAQPGTLIRSANSPVRSGCTVSLISPSQGYRVSCTRRTRLSAVSIVASLPRNRFT